MNNSDPPETSIVIRAFNEEKWLPEVLRAIDAQRYRDFEVLLVDSGSVDRTREIAAENGTRVVRLRSDDFTFGYSLNIGIEAAGGRFIAIVSAHAIPTDETWLERLIAPLRQQDTAMVFGGQRGHEISKFSEARDFERIFGAETKRLVAPDYFANNANSAVRRELWETHRFDEALPGLEDIEWAKHWMDRGMTVMYEPDASIFHIHEESWAQVRRRYHREGIAARRVGIRRARDIPREIWRELRWCVSDLGSAARQSRRGIAREVVRFRYEKTIGTVAGILDGRSITNPEMRAEMYFEKNSSAVVIRGPHEASLEDRPVPTPKPGEILVRVAYQGICATDLEIFEGALGYYKSGIASYPIVPGHECSGSVAAVGARVTDFAKGDRVVVECIQGCGQCPQCMRDNAISCTERREVGVIGLDGGYATYLVTRARYAHKVPSGVTLAQAALAEPLAVVLKAIRRLGAGDPNVTPKRCAVVGAGTIGHLAAGVLAQRGHHVTVFDRDTQRLASINGALQTSVTLTELDSFDWLVEATGDQGALDAMLEHSGTGATLLLLGLPYAHRNFSFESIVGFDRTVIGSVGSSSRDFDDALATLRTLDTACFLETSFPLEKYEDAWEAVRSRKYLKVMLKVDNAAV